MNLFDHSNLSRAIEIKDRSYEFLKLFKENRFKLTGKYAQHSLNNDVMTDVERFKTIIVSHYDDLPDNARPASTSERDVEEFSNFFVSYLFCSFDYEKKPKPRLVQIDSNSNCWCDLCTRLTDAPNLRLKRIHKADKEQADRLQHLALHQISNSKGISLTDEQAKKLLDADYLFESLALVAYGIELLKRREGEFVGTSSLVLWRRFAWERPGLPKKGYVLNAEIIIEAKNTIEKAIEKRIV